MKRILAYLTVYDKILIGIVIGVSVFFIVFPLTGFFTSRQNGGEEFVVIHVGGVEENRIPLSKTYGESPSIYTVEGRLGTSVIELHEGEVRLKQAPDDDPLKICEKTGWVGQPGPMIICVPNEVAIWIETEKYDFDGISR